MYTNLRWTGEHASTSPSSYRAIRLAVIVVVAMTLATGCAEKSPVDPGSSGTVLTSYYDRIPNNGTCDEGSLKGSEKLAALNRLNAMRSRHSLPTVTYNYSKDLLTQRAAMICAANDALSHNPPTSYSCWSKEGALGCSVSNLALNGATSTSPSAITLPTSASFIDLWLTDAGNLQLGHRRWLLNPFLEDISFGRVDRMISTTEYHTFAAVQVLDTGYAPSATAATIDGIAFPQGDYPSALVQKDWYLSFSLLIDKSDYWKNQNVDYSHASVEISDIAGHALTVRSLAYDNVAFGLPNNLQWIVDGLQDGVQYTATIRGVAANSVQVGAIQYSFRLVP